MTYLQDKINTFFKKRNEILKKPLEKIINAMLNKCKYINGESLERHNWGNNPIKLKHIPKNINLPSFEEDLLNNLNSEDNEKSIVELLWGDIQLGKRVQACIIMWISVHILKRPVLYIFRNLTIDQKQLQDDIVGTENYNFNIQFIKTLFQEFNNELQEYFEETNVEYWKDYKLPELKDINSNDIINKLSNKEAINSNDIFCCLMNNTQLAKLNTKFSEYIYYNDELVNITTLVDESDLMSPTSSNDRSNDNDKKDSTACEILLAKIYKKVKYALHITGTAHSLLYNITTRLSDHTDIQIKISKVHKMKRSDDYYGLFNGSINFNTTLVESWWDYQDIENHKKKKCYDIVEDYNINIKKIIEELLKRPTSKYNSLLISEEKIRANQFCLVDKIIKDYPNLFIIIYHGNCLRLYVSKNYEKEIKYWSKWDSKQSSTSQRLCQSGGVYGSSIDNEKSEKLPNNYCYFNINTKILNIKLVYKLLRIFFEKHDTPILCKTIITITGKYGERGYSFTSDDYDSYSLHLTDQYFVSHASLNCTDISQRLRLQGKYNDLDLKNGSMNLTLWTTPELQDIIQNFYVKFIKEIEKFVMGCDTWEDIKDLLESIIDNGDFKFGKYMKYIDVSKKRKNLKLIKHYDRKNNGYKLIVIDDMNDAEISEWCKETKLPDYICINEIQEMSIDKFIDKYGISTIETQEYKLENELSIEFVNYCIKQAEQQFKLKLNPIKPEWFKDRKEKINNYYCESINGSKVPIKISELKNNIIRFRNEDGINDIQRDGNRRVNIAYDDDDNAYICISVRNKNHKSLPILTNDYIKKTPYILVDDKVKYSILKEEYKQQNTRGYTNENGDDFIEDDNTFPEKYYWKTPDGWLYLYDKDKPEIISLDIVAPLPVKNAIQANISTKPLINSDILLFANSCCKKTDKLNLRFGLKDIFKIYETWCKINGKKCLKTQKKFKEEFEKINYKEENSKGIDVNNKPGKRGYNIMVSL
jgi:hypothetical protein